VDRVDRLQHAGVLQDLAEAEQPEGAEPHHHDRTEHPADGLRAASLDGEQGDEDETGDRQHPVGERRGCDLEPLDSAEHGDRRGDQTVTVEERSAEHAEEDQRTSAGTGRLGQHQRGEGEDAPFAVVVGPHHQRQVLDRDDDDQGPEGDRGHPERVRLGDGEVLVLERLSEGVERAGADVTEHHPQRAERERGPRWQSCLGLAAGPGHAGTVQAGRPAAQPRRPAPSERPFGAIAPTAIDTSIQIGAF
jgi:hypothetical protein